MAEVVPPWPPAGWYRDPTGLAMWRYWTGREWSVWVSGGVTVNQQARGAVNVSGYDPGSANASDRSPTASATGTSEGGRQPARWSWTLATVLVLGPGLMWAIYALMVGTQIPFSEWTGTGDYLVVSFMSLYAGAVAVIGVGVVSISACWPRPLNRRWGAAAVGTVLAVSLATFAFGFGGFGSVLFVIGGVLSLAPWAYLWWAMMTDRGRTARIVVPLCCTSDRARGRRGGRGPEHVTGAPEADRV